MDINEIFSSLSEDIVSKFSLCSVLRDENNELIGAMFGITNDSGVDFKFALSAEVIEGCEVLNRVFGSEIKYFNAKEVRKVKDSDMKCYVSVSDVIEKRETNLDWSLEPISSKFGFVFVDGGKYKQSDVIVFDLVGNILDAIEVALCD